MESNPQYLSSIFEIVMFGKLSKPILPLGQSTATISFASPDAAHLPVSFDRFTQDTFHADDLSAT